jgi:hypothetical protein
MADTPLETDPSDLDRPGRPWAQGIGLLLLGLALAAVANAIAMQGEPGLAQRAVSWGGSLCGLLVSGAGVHRLLWTGAPGRRGLRLLVTALVTLPVYAGTALFLSLLFTIVQMRFRS